MSMDEPIDRKSLLPYPDLVRGLYQGILQRPADESGFTAHLRALEGGTPLATLIQTMIASDEFQIHHPIATGRAELPDLTEIYPHKYIRKEIGFSLFEASSDEDFALFESLI